MKGRKIIATILIIMAMTLLLCSCGKPKDEIYANTSEGLINPNASESAKKLYSFLRENYGKKIITGQYVNEYENFASDRFKDEEGKSSVFMANEVRAIHSVTGKYPAILGFDLSQKITGGTNFAIEQALEFHEAGGIVTFCWHWSSPSKTKSHFYTDQTDFSLKDALSDKESYGYKKLIKDIDTISLELKKLEERDVPVLWRPLHEASGGWFWWGDSGKEAYKELWNIMYDRMTNYHHLNNLIWVYNGQKASWYVGDDKCDIIGDDVYVDNQSRAKYSKDKALSKRFKGTLKNSTNKIIALTECNFAPDLDAMDEMNTKWSFYAPWCREFTCVPAKDKVDGWSTMTPNYSEYCNTKEEINAIYNDDRVLTLENLGLYAA